MALIICAECGKKFSDKAIYCPECGCPIEEVLKANSTLEPISIKNNVEATLAIMDEVYEAEKKAKEAELLFDSRNREIQLKSSGNIGLFAGDATARVVEIKFDAKRACDDLYSTYQFLVGLVDGICRPLMQHNPDGEAIKAVYDLIKHLNDESEIESKLTASLNGSNLGNMVNSKYIPSIENKIIQKYWETQYWSTPYAKEYAQKRRQEAEEEKKKKEIEKKKAEEAKRLEEERLSKLGEQLEKNAKEIVALCNKKVSDYKDNMKKILEDEKKDLYVKIALHIDKLKRQKEELETEITGYSIFQIKDKKEKLQRIEILESKIEKLSDSHIAIEEEAKMQMAYDEAIKKYEEKVRIYLLRRFPNKDKNLKPYEKYFEDKKYKESSIPEPLECSLKIE